MGFKGQPSVWQHGPALMVYYHLMYYYYYSRPQTVEPVLIAMSYCMLTLQSDQKLHFQYPAGLFQTWGGQ